MSDLQKYGAFVTIVTGTAMLGMLFAIHAIDGDRVGMIAAMSAAGWAWIAGNFANKESETGYNAAMLGSLITVAGSILMLFI
jgi:hypothetical protein